MDNPTHTDAFLNLLSSCFPCRPSAPALPPSPQLGALLREAESDDAMSLHSTYRPHTRQKKKKASMQLCGLNLFGKPRGQIRLEDDDDVVPRPRPRYDSDAAPLPDSTIQSLARSPTSDQPTRQETPEQELARLRAEKAARKARRRERKLKRQLALEHTEFEGFIGSGDAFPISPPSTTTSTPGIDLLSDRGTDDVDPEDAEADMGAAVYTRSTRSRSESGSSATRSSRARDELVPGNALGLRGPPSPLAQECIPEANERPESPATTRAEPQPAPVPDPKPTRPRPRIHISDMPLSSPGAGPGPRTLEHSPRLAGFETPTPTGYFSRHNPDESPKLAIPKHLSIPPSPSGFPSPGLTRKGFHSPGLGKSHGHFVGHGLNVSSPRRAGGRAHRSPGAGTLPGRALADQDGSQSVLDSAGQFVHGQRRGSGDAGSQGGRGAGDGGRLDGDDARDGGQGAGKRVTPQMGVALANRGGE